MASTSGSNELNSPMEELFVSNTHRLRRSSLRRHEHLHRFNTLMSQLDEIDHNLEILKAGHEQIKEGSSQLLAAAQAASSIGTDRKDSAANLSLHKAPSKASLIVEPVKNNEEKKDNKYTLEKSKFIETEFNCFVLPAALREREKEFESSEEEQQKKSEFVTNLLMLSLFPHSRKNCD